MVPIAEPAPRAIGEFAIAANGLDDVVLLAARGTVDDVGCGTRAQERRGRGDWHGRGLCTRLRPLASGCGVDDLLDGRHGAPTSRHRESFCASSGERLYGGPVSDFRMESLRADWHAAGLAPESRHARLRELLRTHRSAAVLALLGGEVAAVRAPARRVRALAPRRCPAPASEEILLASRCPCGAAGDPSPPPCGAHIQQSEILGRERIVPGLLELGEDHRSAGVGHVDPSGLEFGRSGRGEAWAPGAPASPRDAARGPERAC